MRSRLTCLCITSEMGEGRCEAPVSWSKGQVQAKGFLPCDDGLVKAAKLDKGYANPGKQPV